MAIDYSKFDKAFDLDSLKNDIKEAAENGTGDFPEIPVGQYEVKVEKMELGETGPKSKRPGSPMFKCQFRILDGHYKNSCIFYNQVITEGFQIHLVKKFLESLGTSLAVEFDSFSQFADLLLDMMEEIDGKLEFALNYGENNKGFKTYEIEEVFEVE